MKNPILQSGSSNSDSRLIKRRFQVVYRHRMVKIGIHDSGKVELHLPEIIILEER